MTPDEVKDLTYHEFTLMVYANQLKSVDEEYRDHKLAFLHQMAKQTEGAGKNVRPKYATLQSFYDYREEIDKINNPEKYIAKQRLQDDIASFAMRFNQGGE